MGRLTTAALSVVLSLVVTSAATGATNARCATGSVKGIVWVTGGPKGVGSLTGKWSSAATLFGYRWNCSGGAVSVRRPDTLPEGFDLTFCRQSGPCCDREYRGRSGGGLRDAEPGRCVPRLDRGSDKFGWRLQPSR
jgi:hypothetical protein